MPGVPVTAEVIETDRLRLTPLVPADADAMVEVLGDVRMHTFTGGAPLSQAQLQDRYRRLAVGHSADRSQLWWNWIVRVAADGEPVGTVQATVTSDHSSAAVAWEVGVRWQGRGFASEAAVALVDWLIVVGVPTIEAFIHPDHVASAAVARRAGLESTGEVVDGEVRWLRSSSGHLPSRGP
jgi:RimJ/RimL family protein N-acetyltransferase